MLAADVVMIGGGVTGCAAALAAARRGAEVALLTKLADPEEANTRYAQGGIIYTGPDDSPGLLVRDILERGRQPGRSGATLSRGSGARAGATDRDARYRLRPRRWRVRGAAPHPRRGPLRPVHRASPGYYGPGDPARSHPGRVRGGARHPPPGDRALELAVSGGRCAGVYASRDGEVFTIPGRGVVLATGGLGALYEHTTNPPAATGDGYALALRAGAAVYDLHYVQFHLTALYTLDGERYLISEAVRGEGDVLLDPDGEEFVDHPLCSLAPRDVVAREVRAMMERTGSPCAYLDISHRPARWLRERFPAIYARCSSVGIDMSREPIPVVPAAHYTCGGVAKDVSGRTALRGLWAAGEVASTGLHGSNRLASTSLLEGLVFGWRAGEDAAHRLAPTPDRRLANWPATMPGDALEEAWRRLRRVMWERAGLVRSAEGLTKGLAEVRVLEEEFGDTDLRRALLLAWTVLEGALVDRRSRGCHYRLDAEQEEALADLPG